MDVEARLNEVADHLAHEGLTYRASRVREGASVIARQYHEIERLRGLLKEYEEHAAPYWHARIERLEAALAWTKEVHPGKTREGNAVVEMTWDQFNTMRALAEKEG